MATKKRANVIHGRIKWEAQWVGPAQPRSCEREKPSDSPGLPAVPKNGQDPRAGAIPHSLPGNCCRSSATTSGWVQIPMSETARIVRSVAERGFAAAIAPRGIEISRASNAPERDRDQKSTQAPSDDERPGDGGGASHCRADRLADA